MSLGLACVQCQVVLGASWYWNPARWGTSDGVVPFPILWDTWRAMQSVVAWQQLHQMQAVAMAQPVSEERMADRQRIVDRVMQDAFPQEVPDGRDS